MIADHDRDRRSRDFQNMIVSDRRSWFGKMIVSDRRSQKKVSSLTLLLLIYDIDVHYNIPDKYGLNLKYLSSESMSLSV